MEKHGGRAAELWRIIKFGVVGVANTLVDLVVYTVLAVGLGVNVYLAQAIGCAAGMLNSYLFNRSWTFRSSERFFSPQLVKFIATNLVVLGLSMALLRFFMSSFGLGKLAAKLVVTPFTMVLNFVISRLWVFKPGQEKPTKEV